MKAAIFEGTNQPLVVKEIPTPSPAPDQILVQVAACGLCHTDLHYTDHGVPTFKKPPLVLGHEISGTVAAVGGVANGLNEGQRVLLPAVYGCGRCEMCHRGRANVCPHMIMFGNNIDGGFTEYVLAPAAEAFPLPESIPLVEGCIIADAITTPYHAVVNRGRVRPGDQVVVFGCGGIGLNVVQVAATAGARVIAVDIQDEKLDWARRFGAEEALNSESVERVDKAIRGLTGGGADIAFEAVGHPDVQSSALASLRAGGRFVVVGFSPKPMTLETGRVMFREMEIIGSLGCPPSEYPKVIRLVESGRLKLKELVTGHFALDEVNAALDGLRDGRGLRSVIVP